MGALFFGLLQPGCTAVAGGRQPVDDSPPPGGGCGTGLGGWADLAQPGGQVEGPAGDGGVMSCDQVFGPGQCCAGLPGQGAASGEPYQSVGCSGVSPGDREPPGDQVGEFGGVRPGLPGALEGAVRVGVVDAEVRAGQQAAEDDSGPVVVAKESGVAFKLVERGHHERAPCRGQGRAQVLVVGELGGQVVQERSERSRVGGQCADVVGERPGVSGGG